MNARVDRWKCRATGNIIVGAGIVVICLVAGLAARTSLASSPLRETGTRFLWKIPGYGFIKGVTDSFRGDDTDAAMHSVLAKLDDEAQVALEVERLDDRRVVVYMPGAPAVSPVDIIVKNAASNEASAKLREELEKAVK